MALLTGWLAMSALGGIVNPSLTPALGSYIVPAWPPGQSQTSHLSPVALVTAWPVSTTPRALQGWRAQAFSDDWYYRIHVRPARLDMGNIVSAQTRTVRVWNAYFVPQTLNAVTGLQEGLALTPPHALPATYNPLQEVEWTAQISREGPGRIDATVRFIFAAVTAPVLRITGGRVVEWAFRPDWTEGITERLAWLTEVLASRTGAEQRRSLRLSPRRSFELRCIVEAEDRTRLDLALAAWGARTWALPVWPDVQLLASPLAADATSIACNTTGRDFRAGGLVMLMGASPAQVESAEVLSVAAGLLTLVRPLVQAWPLGTLLCPARTADLAEQPEVVRRNDRVAQVSARFEVAEVCDWPLAWPGASYRSAPVFETRPEESRDVRAGWVRLQAVLDNNSALPQRTDTAGQGFAMQAHRWQLMGRTEQAAWRSLLYALAGRRGVVWLPTHADDLVLVAIAASDALSIDVRNVGLFRLSGGTPIRGRRDMRIELSDGSVVHRRISGISEVSASVERLALDAPPGAVLRPTGSAGVSVNRISFMTLARLEQDDVELLHITDADGAAACEVMWRGRRDDLELAA